MATGIYFYIFFETCIFEICFKNSYVFWNFSLDSKNIGPDCMEEIFQKRNTLEAFVGKIWTEFIESYTFLIFLLSLLIF
jgi:hypothetical protein